MQAQARAELAQAASYRDFLRIAANQAGGCAAFSRRAKFTSRSFLSEVIRGNRRLSHSSYGKVSKALKLPGELRRLFQLLVAKEEPDVVAIAGRLTLTEKISDLRKSILDEPVKRARPIFTTADIPVVFAALGSRSQGASLAEILARTGLKEMEVRSVLTILALHGVAREEGGRFWPVEGDIDLFELGGERGFRESFAEVAQNLSKLVLDAPPSPQRLFFHTAFPVSKGDMNAFKQELRDAVLSVIDKHQTDDGNAVVRLNLGYFS